MMDGQCRASPLRPLCFWSGLLGSPVSNQTNWLAQRHPNPQPALSQKTDSTKLKSAGPVRRCQEVLRVQGSGQREAPASPPFSCRLLFLQSPWKDYASSAGVRDSCSRSYFLSFLLFSFSILHKNVHAHMPYGGLSYAHTPYGGLNCVPPPQNSYESLNPQYLRIWLCGERAFKEIKLGVSNPIWLVSL